jgi:hypothetical protein
LERTLTFRIVILSGGGLFLPAGIEGSAVRLQWERFAMHDEPHILHRAEALFKTDNLIEIVQLKSVRSTARVPQL